MPLIHKKTPAAFKKNIETEIAHGKPQKQAVAIAYSVKDKAGHHKYAEGGCVGASCKGCSDPGCYAHGGQVGVHEPISDYKKGESEGTSVAGYNLRSGEEGRMASGKARHQKNLEDLKRMPKPKLYADGGGVSGDDVPEPNKKNAQEMQKGATEGGTTLSQGWANLKSGLGYAEGGAVDSWTKREDNEKGVHQPFGKGTGSKAGHFVKSSHDYTPEQDKGESMEVAKREHHKKLEELKTMKKPHGKFALGGPVEHEEDVGHAEASMEEDEEEGSETKHEMERLWGLDHGPIRMKGDNPNTKEPFAEGGEVHEDEAQDKELIDDEMRGMLGDELMAAFDAKDKKRIMESLEAIVLSCRRHD
jgi:hypothetical protein